MKSYVSVFALFFAVVVATPALANSHSQEAISAISKHFSDMGQKVHDVTVSRVATPLEIRRIPHSSYVNVVEAARKAPELYEGKAVFSDGKIAQLHAVFENGRVSIKN